MRQNQTYIAVGAIPGGEKSAEATEARLQAHSEALARIEKRTADILYWRKIATGAAVAGAVFAAIRLTDIWLAVKRRRAGK